MKSKDFGSTHETCRNANVTWGSLEWKPSRLKEQFLDCDGRAIFWQAEIFDRKESNSKVLFLSSTSRCRKRTSRNYKKSNDMFILVHHQNFAKKQFPLKHLNHKSNQHFIHFLTWRSHCLKRFPPKSFVRGHGHVCSPHPRPPWPRWAAGGPKRGPSQLRSAAVSCLGKPRPQGPKPAGRTQRNGLGEKPLREFWVSQKISKVKVLEIVDTQNSSLKLNIVVLRCLEAIELLNKNSCLWSSLVKMAWINSNILQL